MAADLPGPVVRRKIAALWHVRPKAGWGGGWAVGEMRDCVYNRLYIYKYGSICVNYWYHPTPTALRSQSAG